MPPPERRALLLLLALAIAGQAVRHLVTLPGEPPGQVQLLSTLAPGSPAAQRDSAVHLGRPLTAGEQIDLDVAPAGELARLPKVGPRLAKIIIADREANGAFGSLEGLDRVSGVGRGLLKLIGPHVRFSGACHGPECIARQTTISRQDLSTGAPAPVIDLNSATVSDLEALPGVGPVKAAAILQYREQHGRFAAVEELGRVPGFGPAAMVRLRDRVSVR